MNIILNLKQTEVLTKWVIRRPSLVVQMEKNLPANTGDARDTGRLDPWVRKMSWRRKWQPAPVFLPGESHRQRSLADHSPKGHAESDRTEVTWQQQQFPLESECTWQANIFYCCHISSPLVLKKLMLKPRL